MQTRLHLISMPWADPELPSIQTGVLKAYVDQTFEGRIPTWTYSAFASIVLEEKRRGRTSLYEALEEYEEYPYFVMYEQRYLQHDPAVRRASTENLLRRINASSDDAREPLTRSTIAHLERRTRRYIREAIGPHLSRRALNVVGFTLNYFQLYASLYCVRALRELYPRHDFLFLFGGATVIYPKVAEVLERLGVEGICVIGEGERKLELILHEILATPAAGRARLHERVAALHEGIYDIQHRSVNLYEPNSPALLGPQLKVETLPLPDFDEYYASLRAAFKRDDQHRDFRAGTWLAMEGTRGCFAHCDFCDVHSSWSGFRRDSAERIAERALMMVHRYGSARIKYMDNVCDTWAEGYADALIKNRIRITCFMECRVHHPEVFWTKLSLSGVELIQVGIEALSPSLLRSMQKGTRAKQNLLVQKWLKELGIESLSNLITHHPKSTLEHVQETKSVIELIPHLDRLDFSNLALLINTPLDRRLDPEERRRLTERQPFALPKGLDRYFVRKGEYEPPDDWFEPGVYDAWDELIAWEKRLRERCGEVFLENVHCGHDEIMVRDGRSGSLEEHLLVGDEARVYDACHEGAALEMLCRALDLAPERVQAIADSLIEKRILVKLEESFIALALRPRDELVRNYIATLGGEHVMPQLAEAS